MTPTRLTDSRVRALVRRPRDGGLVKSGEGHLARVPCRVGRHGNADLEGSLRHLVEHQALGIHAADPSPRTGDHPDLAGIPLENRDIEVLEETKRRGRPEGRRTGTYGINWYAIDPASPFGGFKTSGIGRENGREGLESYLEHKAILMPMGYSSQT